MQREAEDVLPAQAVRAMRGAKKFAITVPLLPAAAMPITSPCARPEYQRLASGSTIANDEPAAPSVNAGDEQRRQRARRRARRARAGQNRKSEQRQADAAAADAIAEQPERDAQQRSGQDWQADDQSLEPGVDASCRRK